MTPIDPSILDRPIAAMFNALGYGVSLQWKTGSNPERYEFDKKGRVALWVEATMSKEEFVKEFAASWRGVTNQRWGLVDITTTDRLELRRILRRALLHDFCVDWGDDRP